MAKLVADQLVETIAQAGIKRIYAVAGDSLNEVNDAVRRSRDIQWIHVRHEETGAFAAAAEAKLSDIANTLKMYFRQRSVYPVMEYSAKHAVKP